ncbi:TIGR03086 family metal-binding protein [Longispora sp. K20-0274]|uniref:TIGR03086 family metal-binding protein n=1 Tax=Longispora sp. K20-0274 TaxID=3088255 RepID=UPI00399968FA
MLDLHRRTLEHSAALVAGIRDDQWDLPTPCAGWTVRDLVTHMVRENRGFAAAADGETSDRSTWSSPIGPDPRADYAASAARVVDAFGADGVLDRRFWLPLIDADVLYPARQAVSFHLLDYLVHGWDVAVSVGGPAGFADDLVAAVTEVAYREVPDGPRRRRTGASFRPALPVPPDAPALDRLLGYLGRDPHWAS